jgi:hypothetical protein
MPVRDILVLVKFALFSINLASYDVIGLICKRA